MEFFIQLLLVLGEEKNFPLNVKCKSKCITLVSNKTIFNIESISWDANFFLFIYYLLQWTTKKKLIPYQFIHLFVITFNIAHFRIYEMTLLDLVLLLCFCGCAGDGGGIGGVVDGDATRLIC